MTAPARPPAAAAPASPRPAPPPRKKSRKWPWLLLAGSALPGRLDALAVL
jgi:hypothetical protein